MNKDFDNNVPDFSKRRISLKVILFLLVISLAILAVQLFFKESLSFVQGNLTIINSFVAFILLFLYITLTADMYVTIKRIKEREKIKVPNDFRVDGFKQTYFIILYIFVLLSALALVFASITTGQNILMTLVSIVIVIIVSSFIYNMSELLPLVEVGASWEVCTFISHIYLPSSLGSPYPDIFFLAYFFFF